jgi:hypothetical protein
MRYIILGIMIGIVGCCVPVPYMVCAQQDGFLGADDVAPPASDNMLPPGAVIEGSYVLHTIQSRQENLHLLASFYYGNPREWRKIYEENRAVIKNPNRLPVGEVIRIHVGENWQPKVAYDKWFALAVRNGEWQPGVRWQRANTVPVPPAPPPEEPPGARDEPAIESSTPEQTPAPEPTSQPQTTTVPTEAPPSEHPEEEPTPVEAAEPESTPADEAAEPEPTPPPEDPDSAELEGTSTEEETPEEPAF